MSFRIDPKKSFAEELQRTGVELIDDAVDALSNQPEGPHAAVHGARKKFKRLRALYRFVAFEEPKFRKAENIRFRDIARSLSQAREAAALVETIHYLQPFSGSQTESQALVNAHNALTQRRDVMTNEEGDLPARIADALLECEKGKHALMHLSLPSGKKTAAKLITKTWRKQRETALHAIGQCHAQAHDEDFHDLRKSGQIYWMHLALMRKIWPSAMRAKRTDAKRLVDLLGHEHDLSVLAAFAGHEPQRFEEGDTLVLLLDAITHRQQALRRECLDLADRVFAESAKAESRIVGLLWEDTAA